MKAINIIQPGGPEVLKMRNCEKPHPGQGEVLIHVKAAGVNRPDVMQRQGKYPAPKGAPPDIPGLEVAGIVERVGEGVLGWREGDRACALVAGGGYAEYVDVPAGQCLPIPEPLSFVEAAGLPETVFTVWHNVFQRGRLQSGESFLVHGGSSGIGITAIQLANIMGARVFATAGTSEKCRFCESLGAQQCINYRQQDFATEMANGIDVILDMVGGPYFAKNLGILNADGRLVYINAMLGREVELDIMKMMLKRLTITGSTLRAREVAFKASLAKEIREKVWPLMSEGKFKPVIYQTFPLEDAAKAHALMESSEHIGKIILEVAREM